MLDLARLRAFVTVANLQSVSRAAEVLHITQSPLSRQVIALEETLGVALFRREKKRLFLTRAGRALLTDAEALLRAAERVEQRARGAGRRLCVGYVAGAVHSGVLFDELRRAGKDTTFELRALRTHEQRRALERGEIDVGYAYGGGTLLAKEPFALAVPRELRSRNPRVLLDTQPFISLPEDSAGRAEILAACARIGARPRVRLEALDPATVLSLVDAGLGVAIVQNGLRRHAPRGVRFVKLPSSFGLEVEIHKLTNDRR